MAGSSGGIPAKFEGTCKGCNGYYGAGELIDRPNRNSKDWMHPACAARAISGPQRDDRRPADRGEERPSAERPPASVHPITPISAEYSEAIRAGWQLRDSLTLIAQGAMAASVAVAAILKVVDPHQAMAHRSQEAKERAS